MPTDCEKPRKERRVGPLELFVPGGYSPGIARIEERATKDLEEHDKECSHWDSSSWLTDYSLLEHSLALCRVMTSIGSARQRSDREIMIGRVAALLHDIGKLEERCRVYRLNRKLVPEEKAEIDTHAGFSGQYILERMADVRPDDHTFLNDVYQVVRNHHKPWRIRDLMLRQIGIDLKLADIFVARQEKRDRPGLSQFESLEVLFTEVQRMITEEAWERFGSELVDSYWFIHELYGKESMLAYRPS